MALFLVEVRKATQLLGGRKWSNRYFVDAANLTEALDGAETIWQAGERQFHYSDVYCYEVYANLVGDVPFTPGSTSSPDASVAFGLLNPAGAGEVMPTFCVVRVDFPVLGSRPSRKFYRPLLRESDVVGDQLAAGGLVNIALAAGLPDLVSNTIRDPDNEPWQVGGFVVRGVSSRRLGRDSFVSVPPPPVVAP